MRITIIAAGTRGDAQPAIALGKGLKTAGHQVRIVASDNFANWVTEHGLEFAPLGLDIQTMMNTDLGKAWADSKGNAMKSQQAMRKLLEQHGWTMITHSWEACKDAEVVISGFTSDFFAQSFAEKLGVPWVTAQLQPLQPTRLGSSSSLTLFFKRNSIINLVLGRYVRALLWRWYAPHLHRLRREVLGLPEQTVKDYVRALDTCGNLYGFSKHVIPTAPEWTPKTFVTGYWFLDEGLNWQPPAPLADFLSAGDAPIYLGFGSMSSGDPEGTTTLILEALRLTGKRAVLASGWAGLKISDLPKNVYALDSAPHEWLFPRMAGVVHHGGAGTTAAGLRAGIPSFLVPHMADQPFWAARVESLGVGPTAIPRHKLTASALASALQTMDDPVMRQRTADLGAKIRAEDGVGGAVRVFDQVLR